MKVLNLGLYYRSFKYQSEWSKLWICSEEEHVHYKVFHFPVSEIKD